MSCEKCGNEYGFAFGTCIDCGWNSNLKKYEHIKVYVEDLPFNIRGKLIQKHDKRMRNASV